MKDWLSPDDPTYWNECADCGHYRSEHAAPPDPVCGCDVLSFGEWHVCPCPAFTSDAAQPADDPEPATSGSLTSSTEGPTGKDAE